MPKDYPVAYDTEREDEKWAARRRAGAKTADEQQQAANSAIRTAYEDGPPYKPPRPAPKPPVTESAPATSRQLTAGQAAREAQNLLRSGYRADR